MQESAGTTEPRVVTPAAHVGIGPDAAPPAPDGPPEALAPVPVSAAAPILAAAPVRARRTPPKLSFSQRLSRAFWSLVRSLLWLALLAGIGYALWLAAQPYAFGPKVSSQAVSRGTVVQTVVASGNVQTPSRVEIGTQGTGIVAKVLAEAGSRVTAGQVLVELDHSEADATVEQMRAGLRQAEVRLKQIADVALPVAEQTVRQAEANRLSAQQQLKRIQKLRQQGFATVVQLEEAQRAFDVASSQRDTAKMQAASNRKDGSERVAAVAAIDLARANLAAAQTRLSYLTVKSPLTGTVITRTIEPGALAQPGRVMFQISPDGATELVLQIDERNLRYLKLGQTALVSADAFPGERFEARLAVVDPAVDRERGAIEVKLAVDKPPAFLRQDMTVSVDIEVARIEDAITIGLDAVRDQGGDKGWVWRLDGDVVRRQEVALGVRGGGKVQILDGLEAGDQVVPMTAGALTDGQRVRAAPEDPSTRRGRGSRRSG
jgi:HlyD family secretion protein